jgi:hypothetical protein
MMVENGGQAELEMGEPLDDPELLMILRGRENNKPAATAYRRLTRQANEKAGPKLLDGKQHTCGEFLLKGTRIEGGHRDFDVKDSFRVSIKRKKNGKS